ncbi:helix-turn-helix domain-containing protein [Bacillus wiedmannii]
MSVHKAFKFRIYPNKKQEIFSCPSVCIK